MMSYLRAYVAEKQIEQVAKAFIKERKKYRALVEENKKEEK